MPYLFSYLLYAWLKWPVNPVSNDEIIRSLPSLLHIYWFWHALHFLLGGYALYSWWARPFDPSRPIPEPRPTSVARLWPAVPWILLACLIWIPGVYLEFPSDATAHLGRIVEWSRAGQVAENSSWFKSSYFLTYSLTLPDRRASFETLLRLYYTGICLLLSWQSYRLALEMKLGRAASFLFAALQLVVFGNSAFSYHRYYGLSSTIVSHLAVVGLLRLWVGQIVAPPTNRTPGRAAFATTGFLVLIVFNHIQGILVVMVSLVALGCWQLSRSHRMILFALFTVLAAGSSALIAWAVFSPPASLTALQEAGWLNSIGSFNLLQGGSPARHRALELIGLFGLGSGVLALFMFKHNHLGAWLMTVPWVLLLVPVTAYPLALLLQGGTPFSTRGFLGQGSEYLTVFSRQLFAMPLALPVAWLFSELLDHAKGMRLAPTVVVAVLWILLTLPTQSYGHARLWQALAPTPVDLKLDTVRTVSGPVREMAESGGEKKVVGAGGVSYLLGQMGVRAIPYARRLILYPNRGSPSFDQQSVQDYLNSYWQTREFIVVLPEPRVFVSPCSQSALLSRHWLPQEATLTLAGGHELAEAAESYGFRKRLLHPQVMVLTNIP